MMGVHRTSITGDKIMKLLQRGIRVLLAAALGIGAVANAAPNPEALILGDSVPFGYIDPPGYEAVNANNFFGFPGYLDLRLGFDSVNAACPGETTGSFLSALAPDDGCRDYRAAAPLHVLYGSTQLKFAQRYLATHSQVHLITITLGANDVYLLEHACNNDLTCVQAGFPDVAARVAANVETILGSLRATGYRGEIVLTNYYSLDYTDPVLTGFSQGLNIALAAPARAFGADVADLFTAFKRAARPVGGRTCAAGLLNVSNPVSTIPPFSCDIHPSQSGQRLIAETIATSLKR
jgi:lysophospholipase L1-like esterase